jgi:regulator of sigma E protease
MIVTALIFIAILTILVLIHELGHYTVARIIGVRVDEFGLGLPPRAIGKTIKNTIYSINWLPIGGFVKLAGEDEEGLDDNGKPQKIKNKKQYFWARSKKERSAILIAGVTMNFLLAVVITAGLLVNGVKEPSGIVRIESITPNSPAEQAGLRANDVILSIASGATITKVKTSELLISTVAKHKGEKILVTYTRERKENALEIIPRKEVPQGQGPLGVVITDLETKKYSLWEAPYASLKINLSRAWLMLVGIVTTLWKLVTFQGVGADVAGPIGIAQVTGQAAKFGFRALLDFMSILSLNLAVLNILPIPALDGGRLAFVFAEKILGRKIKPAFEKQTHQIGMLILLFLVLLISIGDIMRLARGG